MVREIEVHPHDPQWEKAFELEAKKIQEALGKNCIAVHHIGSTAIPDLVAKPVIDIMPIVKDLSAVDRSNAALRHLGYEARGEAGIIFRRYFAKGGDHRSHHLHVFEHGNDEIDRHLSFKHWLINNPKDSKAYGELKTDLAKKYPHDPIAYCFGKDGFVAHIAEKTGWRGKRVVIAFSPTEKKAYHSIVAEHLFEPNKLQYDPKHPQNHTNKHFHFVQYKGNEIITAAHIEFLHNEKDVALRWLVSLPKHTSQGNSKSMLNMLETWCKQQGRLTMKLHATPKSEEFFKHLGYQSCDFSKDPSLFDDHTDLFKTL